MPEKQTVAEWRGMINEKLHNIQGMVEKFDGKLNGLPDWKNRVDTRLSILETRDNPGPKNNLKNANVQYVSWSWLRDELIMPIIKYGITLVLAYVFGKLTGVIP